MTTLLICTDLMFASRVQGAAAAAGKTVEVKSGSSVDKFEAMPDCSLVIIDLTEFNDDISTQIAKLKACAPRARLIAFGSHVDVPRLSAAKEAGCDDVWARGMFVQQLPGLFR